MGRKSNLYDTIRGMQNDTHVTEHLILERISSSLHQSTCTRFHLPEKSIRLVLVELNELTCICVRSSEHLKKIDRFSEAEIDFTRDFDI